jgi:8-oxo-dGTP diphosphatase
MKYTYRFPRPAITIDVLISRFHNDIKEILLVMRKNEPFRDKWALPGGFVNNNELLKDAAIRELSEETGLKIQEIEQFHVFDKPGRDPRERTITVVFTGIADEYNSFIKPSSDAKDARWFPLESLPELAFDHGEIVALAESVGRI